MNVKTATPPDGAAGRDPNTASYVLLWVAARATDAASSAADAREKLAAALTTGVVTTATIADLAQAVAERQATAAVLGFCLTHLANDPTAVPGGYARRKEMLYKRIIMNLRHSAISAGGQFSDATTTALHAAAERASGKAWDKVMNGLEAQGSHDDTAAMSDWENDLVGLAASFAMKGGPVPDGLAGGLRLALAGVFNRVRA